MTEITQLVLGITAAALPTITVLVGILLNRSDSQRLDTRITLLETSLRGEMADLTNSLRSEMSALATSLRSEMSAMRGQFHSDIMMLVSSDK